MEFNNLSETQDLYEYTDTQQPKFTQFLQPTGYDIITFFSILLFIFADKKPLSFVLYMVITLLYIVIAYILTKCGIAIAKFLLNYARPTFYSANGFWDCIAKRFFWNYGPQITTVVIINFMLTGLFFGIFVEDSDYTKQLQQKEVSQNVDYSSKNNVVEQSNQQHNDIKKEQINYTKTNIKQTTNVTKQYNHSEHINNNIDNDLNEFMN